MEYLEASDSLEALEFLAKIRRPNSVMQNTVGPKIIGVGPTSDANDGEVLTVGAGNGVDHTEPTNSESNNTRPHALGPRVAISSVASVELVAAANQVQFSYQVVQQSQVKITRH